MNQNQMLHWLKKDPLLGSWLEAAKAPNSDDDRREDPIKKLRSLDLELSNQTETKNAQITAQSTQFKQLQNDLQLLRSQKIKNQEEQRQVKMKSLRLKPKASHEE